jgi:hypothetical protein
MTGVPGLAQGACAFESPLLTCINSTMISTISAATISAPMASGSAECWRLRWTATRVGVGGGRSAKKLVARLLDAEL